MYTTQSANKIMHPIFCTASGIFFFLHSSLTIGNEKRNAKGKYIAAVMIDESYDNTPT